MYMHTTDIPLDVFFAVQSSDATFGVIPFENSSNGSVLQTLDLLVDKEKDFPDTQVCAEAYLDVQHCLLGRPPKPKPASEGTGDPHSSPRNPTNMPFPREPRAKPSRDIEHVNRIYSHPQAFGQSEAFLSTYLKLAKRHELSSTSEAARIVAQDESGESAAIASRLAADIHGLVVLAEGIQDVENNTTRFLIIQKGSAGSSHQELLPASFNADSASDQDRKSLVAFSINHETKGALANALWIFRKHELNLTSINSRPSRVRPWHYIFLVEFEGKEESRTMDLFRLALKDLDDVTEGTKWLGSWIDRFGQ